MPKTKPMKECDAWLIGYIESHGTVTGFAEEVGISQGFLSGVRHGTRSISPSTVERIEPHITSDNPLAERKLKDEFIHTFLRDQVPEEYKDRVKLVGRQPVSKKTKSTDLDKALTALADGSRKHIRVRKAVVALANMLQDLSK